MKIVDSLVRKLRKLFDQYCVLKKLRLIEKDSYRYLENQFQNNLLELFDISRKDVLSIMTNEEDKKFLQVQRDQPLSASMAGNDKHSLINKHANISEPCRRLLERGKALPEALTNLPLLSIQLQS